MLLCPKWAKQSFYTILDLKEVSPLSRTTQDNFRTAAPCCVVMVLQVGQQISFQNTFTGEGFWGRVLHKSQFVYMNNILNVLTKLV